LNDLLAEMDPLASSGTTKQPSISPQQQTKPKVNNPAAFLGENSALVNLDNLIKPINTTSNNNAYNPFESPAMRTKNLFQQNQPQVISKF
jgi:epsin